MLSFALLETNVEATQPLLLCTLYMHLLLSEKTECFLNVN